MALRGRLIGWTVALVTYAILIPLYPFLWLIGYLDKHGHIKLYDDGSKEDALLFLQPKADESQKRPH